MGKRFCQRLLIYVADHYHYHLLRGNRDPHRSWSDRIFMEGPWYVGMDLVRNAALQLISREVNDHCLEGAVAELGVYQGEFARLIATHFSGRKFYLFDTFEGFDERDSTADRQRGFSSAPDDFADTSIPKVLAKLPSSCNALVKRGWFPQSAQDCADERFCFVSLDVDLFEPTYAGLQWFYPRLCPGGYIMVHDYNSTKYKGVMAAVRRFAAETALAYVTLPDTCGTVVIAKPLLLNRDARVADSNADLETAASAISHEHGTGTPARPESVM